MANEPAVLRTREEIARFFDGFELLEPGLVPVSCWRPGTGMPSAGDVWFAAGVGRKPGGPGPGRAE